MEFLLVAMIGLTAPLLSLSFLFTLDLLVVAGEAVWFLAEVFSWLLSGRSRRSRATRPESAATGDSPPPVRRKSPWRRRILLAALAAFGLLLAGVWVVNRFHFEPFMRWGAARLEKSAGVAVDFKSVSGSLWTGELRFTGLSVKRGSHPLSTFDVAVDRVDMQVSVFSLLWRQLQLESLMIEGVRGTWTRQAKAEKSGLPQTFSISDFSLADFLVSYHNLPAGPAAKPVEVRVDAMRSMAGLSSKWLIIDLLFMSRAEGAIDGAPYFIGPIEETPSDMGIVWKCEGLPLPVLASLVGKPLTIFERGKADVFIKNSVSLPEFALEMDWNVVLTDFRASVPSDWSLKEKAVGFPVAAFLNLKRERLDLNFKAKLGGKGGFVSTSDDLESALDLGGKLFGTVHKITLAKE